MKYYLIKKTKLQEKIIKSFLTFKEVDSYLQKKGQLFLYDLIDATEENFNENRNTNIVYQVKKTLFTITKENSDFINRNEEILKAFKKKRVKS